LDPDEIICIAKDYKALGRCGIFRFFIGFGGASDIFNTFALLKWFDSVDLFFELQKNSTC